MLFYLGQTDVTDDNISMTDSLKSYKEKTALSRRIQSYNKVLTDREIQANNRMEMLRETLIQKEMEQCTFQPTISSVAQRLKVKEMDMMYQSQQLEDSGSASVGGSVSGPVKVYDRLYAERDTVPRSIVQDKHEPSADTREGLNECTFAPRVQHRAFASFNHDPEVPATTAGETDSVEEEEDEEEEEHTGRRRKSRMETNMDNFFGDLEKDSGNQNIFKPASRPSPSESLKKKQQKAKKESSATTVKPPVIAPRGYSDSIKR